MLKAIVSKELRETVGIALLALLAYACLVAGCVGWRMPLPLRFTYSAAIPFVADDFLVNFTVVAAALCLALGLRQSVAESIHGTWLFLFHRPADRRKIVVLKLVSGLSVYLLCSALPILAYAFWAASPGKHAGPFFWEMTIPAWQTYLLMPGLYLGAFLTGIRPGRWFGTRLLPAAAVALLLTLIYALPAWWILGLGALVVLEACLIGLILFVAIERDF
jgi:hypothetical protein